MPCPFLREGRARYCHAAPVRKLILDGPGATDGGRCASARYVELRTGSEEQSAARSLPASGRDSGAVLRRLSDSETGAVQRFGIIKLHQQQVSILRFLPAPGTTARSTTRAATLLYTQNHFWLDAEESGLCHIGIDGFWPKSPGTVDGVTFVSSRGTHCPALALTVHGVEWPMSFPNPVMIQKVNSRLRSDPARLTADPYGAGWLFEGWEVPGRTRAGLISGPQAAAWQAQRTGTAGREIHETHAPGCDGGTPVRGVARFLSREDLVCLFQHFFSRTDWSVER